MGWNSMESNVACEGGEEDGQEIDVQSNFTVTVTGHKGMEWSCDRGSSGWTWGKSSSLKDGWSLEQDSQGRGHNSKVSKLRSI